MRYREPEPKCLDDLIQDLNRTRKYKRVHDQLLYLVAHRALDAHKGRDALKAAKRSLHEITGAFLSAESCRRAERLVQLLAEDSTEHRSQFCRQILRLHASSAERLPMLRDMYERVWSTVTTVRGVRRADPVRVLDVACGLNPFALPWMGLPAGSSYQGMDADGRVVDLARLALPHLHLPELAHPAAVEIGEVLASALVTSNRFDVVLLLKTIPTIERLSPGASKELLQRISAPVVVISTATGSLGRRSKRHLRHDAKIERIVEESGRKASRFRIASEAVVVAW